MLLEVLKDAPDECAEALREGGTFRQAVLVVKDLRPAVERGRLTRVRVSFEPHIDEMGHLRHQPRHLVVVGT